MIYRFLNQRKIWAYEDMKEEEDLEYVKDSFEHILTKSRRKKLREKKNSHSKNSYQIRSRTISKDTN